jgi:hypothetical protein
MLDAEVRTVSMLVSVNAKGRKQAERHWFSHAYWFFIDVLYQWFSLNVNKYLL